MGNSISIREAVATGKPINVNAGTFQGGGRGGALYFDYWVDRVTLATNGTKFSLFNTPVDTSGRTPADTNTRANVVPQGERWDLVGLIFFVFTPAGATMTEAQKVALNAFIASAFYSISFNTQTVRSMPLWVHFGSQLAQETVATPATAMQSPVPKRNEYIDVWPDECFLPMQSGINMEFNVNHAALPAALNNFQIGAAFARWRASETP